MDAVLFKGATTLNKTTSSLMTLSLMTLSILTFSLMTFSLMTLSEAGQVNDLSIAPMDLTNSKMFVKHVSQIFVFLKKYFSANAFNAKLKLLTVRHVSSTGHCVQKLEAKISPAFTTILVSLNWPPNLIPFLGLSVKQK
jgi:hypothetical protein